MACLSGEPYLFCVRARFVCAYAFLFPFIYVLFYYQFCYIISFLLHFAFLIHAFCYFDTFIILLWWRGGGSPNAWGGRALPSYSLNLLHSKCESRKSQNDAVLSPHCTVVRHEKHRPSGVKSRRRQFPPIAMYSKLF